MWRKKLRNNGRLQPKGDGPSGENVMERTDAKGRMYYW